METLNDLSFVKPKHDQLKPKTIDNMKEERKRKIQDMKDKSKMIKYINDTIKQIMDCSNVSVLKSDGDLEFFKTTITDDYVLKSNLSIKIFDKLEISDTNIDSSTKIIKKIDLTIDFTYLSFYINCLKYIFTTLYDLVDFYHFVEFNTIINNLRYLNGITITIEDKDGNSYNSSDFTNNSRTFLTKCEELETISKNINNSLLNFDCINKFKFVVLDKMTFEAELKLQLITFINLINDSVIILNSIKESYDKLTEK